MARLIDSMHWSNQNPKSVLTGSGNVAINVPPSNSGDRRYGSSFVTRCEFRRNFPNGSLRGSVSVVDVSIGAVVSFLGGADLSELLGKKEATTAKMMAKPPSCGASAMRLDDFSCAIAAR